MRNGSRFQWASCTDVSVQVRCLPALTMNVASVSKWNPTRHKTMLGVWVGLHFVEQIWWRKNLVLLGFCAMGEQTTNNSRREHVHTTERKRKKPLNQDGTTTNYVTMDMEKHGYTKSSSTGVQPHAFYSPLSQKSSMVSHLLQPLHLFGRTPSFVHRYRLTMVHHGR